MHAVIISRGSRLRSLSRAALGAQPPLAIRPLDNGQCRLWNSAAAEGERCTVLAKAMSESKPLAPAGLSRTFYKRELPCPPAVEFSSTDGRQIFAAALAAGTMDNYFKLAEQFRTQDEPAFCGLASVAMVLNTLAIDPRRAWKGPWRFFHEQMLDCCHPLEKVKEEGITLEQAACLARCNGAKVEVFSHGSVSVQGFRGMVVDACRGGNHHLVVSYSRRQFLQTGDGHFSPIGGYSAARDLVLILDTARFKYPPHWVPLEMLYAAMAHVDPATGRPRGFMRLGLQPRLDSVLFTLDLRHPAWQVAFEYVDQGIACTAGAAAASPDATAESVLASAALAAPVEAVGTFVAVRMAGSGCNGGVCTQAAAVDTFLHELRGMPLFRAVQAAVNQQQEEAGETSAAGEEGRAALAATAAVSSSGVEQSMAIDLALPQPASKDTAQSQVLPEDASLRQLSSHAAAASSATPAVPGDLLVERLCMLLLLAPPRAWQQVQPAPLQQGVLDLLETAARYKVVGIEAEYLRGQLHEVPAMRAAMEAWVAECRSDECRDAGVHVCSGGELAQLAPQWEGQSGRAHVH